MEIAAAKNAVSELKLLKRKVGVRMDDMTCSVLNLPQALLKFRKTETINKLIRVVIDISPEQWSYTASLDG